MEKQQLQKADNRTSATKENHAPFFNSAFPSRVLPQSKTGDGIPVQAQLETTTPGDPLEQEADSVSELVMRKMDSGAEGSIPPSSNDLAVSAFGGSSVSIPSEMESRLFSSLGGGHSLPSLLRSQMELGFGRSLPDVHIHTGSEASELSSSIGAKAFTYGNDIYFNEGQFQPGTAQGNRLIAHELTHTVQQSGKVARSRFIVTDDEKRATIKSVKREKNIPKYLKYIIEYLFEYCGNGTTINENVVDCYYHAVYNATVFKKGQFNANLKLFFGDSAEIFSEIPPDVFFDKDPEQGVAKWHYKVLKQKIESAPETRNPSGSLVTGSPRYFYKCKHVREKNAEDSRIPPMIQLIEDQYLAYRMERLSSPSPIDTSGLIGGEIWGAGLVFMLVTPFLAAGAISGVALGSAGSALSVAVNSKKGTVIIGAAKNILGTAYSIAKASPAERKKDGYIQDQVIDCAVNIFLDILFDYFGSDISGAKKKILWDNVRAVFKGVWGLAKDGASKEDIGSFLARELSTGLANSGISVLAGVEVPLSFLSEDMINSILGLLLGEDYQKEADSSDNPENEYQAIQKGFTEYTLKLMQVS